MTVEIMSLITVLSVTCSIFFGYKAFSRNKTSDDKADATQMATIIVKLDTIENTVKDIKEDNKGFQVDIKEIREKLIKLESKVANLEDIVYQDSSHKVVVGE